ncbi:DUF2274 domain-containing protein [Sphingomonas sp. LaA6.9]|uniref:DUF2274 domain-containing protein n=1 Tax=Sphingomonas sp. LaA6.9 TaxID=2919914 RepID=UPI001F4F3854|nr:DUF2274 domain-containing protein [Sphingomonas sp. LaA6.9]MCJ8159168.1 DUF2274 domain-containing protein [Sphingomonas sp. LaA6.9]
MPDLKLARIPDRTPVKLTILLSPELKRTLDDYAAIYNETYGESEALSELLPPMLAAFLASDHAFAKARKHREGRE